MKNMRVTAAALALMMCAVSCGSSGEASGMKENIAGGGLLTGKAEDLEGEYATVTGLHSPAGIFNTGIDEGLHFAVQDYKESNAASLSFDGGSFKMLGTFINTDWSYFSGTYTLSGGKIIFSYEKFHNENIDADINESIPEIDEDIIKHKYNAAALEGLSKDEQKERIKAEQQKMSIKSTIEKMQKFNKTGTYWDKVAPRLMFSDKVYSISILPMFCQRSAGAVKNPDTPYMLCPVDDFICVETFGMELDGGYSLGEDFKVSFDPFAPFYDDEYSTYNLDEGVQNNIDERNEVFLNRDFGGSRDTTISFSNGKWQWTDAGGELINDGSYLESTEHEGLIAMSVDESSKNNDETYRQLSPLLFYIDGSGKIWYPNWVKMN